MTEPRAISSAEELLAIAELNDVIYVRMECERHEPLDLDFDQPDIRLHAGWSDDLIQLVVKAEVSVRTREANLMSEVQVQYRLSEPATVDEPAVGEFLGRSAVLVAAPYLREAIASMAARLRVPVPNFPLVRPGPLEPFTRSGDVDLETE